MSQKIQLSSFSVQVEPNLRDTVTIRDIVNEDLDTEILVCRGDAKELAETLMYFHQHGTLPEPKEPA